MPRHDASLASVLPMNQAMSQDKIMFVLALSSFLHTMWCMRVCMLGMINLPVVQCDDE